MPGLTPQRSYTFISVFLLLSASTLQVSAWDNNGRFHIADVSLDQAVSDVKRRTGDRVLSADTVRKNGQNVHRIRVLNNKGQVKQMRVDGKNGREIRYRH